MDALAEALAWRIVNFVEAAERVSWPLPLSVPPHALTRRSATSPALNPADFGLHSQPQFDAAGIIAYGINLRASMESFEEGVDADEDQVLISLEIAYDLFSSEFGTPYLCVGLEVGTGYYWWQRPSGLRMHLYFTAEATAELWVARPPEMERPPVTPANTVWGHIDALLATDWTESLLGLLKLARARGWSVLSDSYEYFYLNRGIGGAAQLAESHPHGIPDYAVICSPPEVAVVADLPGSGRLLTTFAVVAEQEMLVAQLCSRYGAASNEGAGTETKYTWQAAPGKTLTVTLRGPEVSVDVYVTAYSETRPVSMQEYVAQCVALLGQLTETTMALTAADIARVAQANDWVRVGPESETEEVFFTRQSAEGRPGVVVNYRNGFVEQVFLQALPRGLTTAHLDDVHTGLMGLLGQLSTRFDSFGKQNPPVKVSPDKYRGRADAQEPGHYRFLAKNGSALVTVVPSRYEVRVAVSYPLTDISPTLTAREIEPINTKLKITSGTKHVLLLLVVLLVAVIARLFT